MTLALLHVHRSNRPEKLVDALYENLRAPLTSPFDQELIVVQGQGMATWLNMELSQRAGVWANTQYLYPKHFIERLFEMVLGKASDDSSLRENYTPDSLLWTIAARLPLHLSDPAFEALRDYVGSPVDENRLFLLAGKIADTFDEYLTFRPELVRLWSKADAHFAEPQLDLFQQSHASDPAIWQRKLWRDIEAVLGAHHTAALEKRCHAALSRRKTNSGLPERVSLFGLSTLPPLFIRLLAALCKHVPVHLYLQSPTEEYFGDILLDHQARQSHTEGNRLVRTLAPLAAEFNQVITESCEALGVGEAEQGHYQAPPSPSLLHHVQRDLLNFTETKDASLRADGSLVVHSCHSPIREVEVLHDQVLELVHRHGYRPEDILVLLPDVEAYAPLLDAVFRRDDDRFLPYRIADRQADAESAVVKAFLRILDLATERVTSAQVMDVVSLPPVRKRFLLDAIDLPIITEWLVSAHVTWGMNLAHRQQEGSDAPSNTTWQAALDRLLLGYAVDTMGEQLVCGLYPYEHIEGKHALLLGNFRHFTSRLFGHLEQLTRPRLPAEWQLALSAVLEDLLEVSKEEFWQKQDIMDALEELSRLGQRAGYDKPVSVRVVRRLLYQRLERQGAARGFLAGGITMSALIPMRSVPFEVICILGMNDGAFPRDAHRSDFNLLEHGDEKRRYGDPNRRFDDRYLFLEALTSARSRFIVTYVGQSVRDNTARSPSVVLMELLDVVRGCATDASQLDGLVIRHPLQPFSRRYFDGHSSHLHSYAREFIPRVQEASEADAAFLSAPLTADASTQVVPLSELLAFFRSPTRYFLERRLKVRFQEQLVTLQEHDATSLDPLEAYQVGAPLLQQIRRGIPLGASMDLARARGALPCGQLGKYAFHQLEYTALSLAEIAETLHSQHTPRQVEVSCNVGRRRVEGCLNDVYPDRRVHIQFARVTGRVILRTWVEHVLLACSEASFTEQGQTWLVGREEQGERAVILRFEPLSAPQAILADLVSLFEQGCRTALPLFPDLAFKYMTAKDRSATNSLAKDWEELLERDAAVARVFGPKSRLRLDEPMLVTDDPSYPLFTSLSERLLQPLLQHLTTVGSTLSHEAV